MKQPTALDNGDEVPSGLAHMFRAATSALSVHNYDRAEQLFKTILVGTPAHAPSLKNLGMLYIKRSEFSAAELAYRKAATHFPQDIEALFGLGLSVHEAGRLSEAIDHYESILAIDPDFVAALHNIANALRDEGQLERAAQFYRRALARKPEHHVCALNYSAALFYQEDWGEAWRAFEARLRVDRLMPSMLTEPTATKPGLTLWRAGPQPTSLLVVAEQGLGDTIQFARFLPDLARTGTKLTLMVDRELFGLLSTLDADITLVPRGERISLEGMEAWIPLLSLPLAMGLRPGGLAPNIPYLRAEPERVAYWRDRIGRDGLKIGIAWQGNPAGAIDRGRSIPLSLFASLAAIPGVRLISLQKGLGQEQIGNVPFSDRIETLGPEFDDGDSAFLDSAAVMMSLDVVLTIDTAIAHLAGALGRPLWLMLKKAPNWRWLLVREDSPFYPTARLFRQTEDGDWSKILMRVANEFGQLALRGSGAPTAVERGESDTVQIPVSIGELLDKIVILEIKSERIRDPAKLANVDRELAALQAALLRLDLNNAILGQHIGQLKRVNATLWDVEDAIRDCEADGDFGAAFIELARTVYQVNDERAQIKRAINIACGSMYIEEKSYRPQTRTPQ